MSNLSSDSWAASTRRALIASLLRRDGYIQRGTVATLLDMSPHQISADLQRMLEIAPGLLDYSPSQKRYNLNPKKAGALDKFAPPSWLWIAV